MIDRYLEYINIEKRYSPNTIISYRKDLEDFAKFLLDTESIENLQKADKKIVRNFIIHLNNQKLSKRSINRKISTLKSFYNFLLRISEIKTSPLEGISMLKFYAEKQIPFKLDIYPYYGSDASAAMRAGAEVKHALLGAGIESSHSYERTHIDSVEATQNLVDAYLQSELIS